MFRLLTIAVCTIGLSLQALAQRTEPSPATQWSFGLHLEQYPLATGERGPRQASELSENGGIYLGAEARVAARFSWLLGAGYQRTNGWTSWGEVPLDNVFNGRPEPNFVDRRLIDNATHHWRRFFLGGGAQVNFRLGSGDLSLGTLLTFDRTQLSQTVAFGRSVVGQSCDDSGCDGLAASRLLDGTAVVRYRPVYRAGGRLQATYTHWLSRQTAVRIGGTLDMVGPRFAGAYREATDDRFAIAEIDNSHEIRRGVEDYGLPEESYFRTPSPTQTYLLPGLTAGLVYKPTGQAGPLPAGSRFGLDLSFQAGPISSDADDVGPGFARQIGLAAVYDLRTKWVEGVQLMLSRQSVGGFRGAYGYSDVLTGPDGQDPAVINLRTSLQGWSATGVTVELRSSPWRQEDGVYVLLGGGAQFLGREMLRSEWFAQDAEGTIYASGRDGYRLTEGDEGRLERGDEQSLLNRTAMMLDVGVGCYLDERIRLSFHQTQYIDVGRRLSSGNHLRYLGLLNGTEVRLTARLFNAD